MNDLQERDLGTRNQEKIDTVPHIYGASGAPLVLVPTIIFKKGGRTFCGEQQHCRTTQIAKTNQAATLRQGRKVLGGEEGGIGTVTAER